MVRSPGQASRRYPPVAIRPGAGQAATGGSWLSQWVRYRRTPAIRQVPGEVEACEAMASAWEAIGINTTITKVDLGPLIPAIMDGVDTAWHGAECHGTSSRLQPFSVQGLSATNGFILGGSHPDLIELLDKIPAAVREEAVGSHGGAASLGVRKRDGVWDLRCQRTMAIGPGCRPVG